MNEDELAAVIAALQAVPATQSTNVEQEAMPAWRRAARLEGADVQ